MQKQKFFLEPKRRNCKKKPKHSNFPHKFNTNTQGLYRGINLPMRWHRVHETREHVVRVVCMYEVWLWTTMTLANANENLPRTPVHALTSFQLQVINLTFCKFASISTPVKPVGALLLHGIFWRFFFFVFLSAWGVSIELCLGIDVCLSVERKMCCAITLFEWI